MRRRRDEEEKKKVRVFQKSEKKGPAEENKMKNRPFLCPHTHTHRQTLRILRKSAPWSIEARLPRYGGHPESSWAVPILRDVRILFPAVWPGRLGWSLAVVFRHVIFRRVFLDSPHES